MFFKKAFTILIVNVLLLSPHILLISLEQRTSFNEFLAKPLSYGRIPPTGKTIILKFPFQINLLFLPILNKQVTFKIFVGAHCMSATFCYFHLNPISNILFFTQCGPYISHRVFRKVIISQRNIFSYLTYYHSHWEPTRPAFFQGSLIIFSRRFSFKSWKGIVTRLHRDGCISHYMRTYLHYTQFPLCEAIQTQINQ